MFIIKIPGKWQKAFKDVQIVRYIELIIYYETIEIVL